MQTMKKHLLLYTLLLLMGAALAQPKPKAKQVSDVDKIMAEAMKGMSPEEKKQMEEAMLLAKQMQQKGMTGNVSTDNVPKIPKKQVKLLSSMPSLTSQQQYSAYLSSLLSSCKKNIQPSVISKVDGLISEYRNNYEATVNIGPVLFLQKNPSAAIYAAIKTAIDKPEDLLLQDNLAVLLHQTGYPQKALPILKFLTAKNSSPTVLNNLAQSYLSLGDTVNARKFFMGCLQKDADHCEANCGMGLLLVEAGKIGEAIPYIIKSLRNGYTETADALLKKSKAKIKFSDIKQPIPEYFNPQKYKPIPPAYKMDMVKPTVALREELQETMRLWIQKKQRVNEEQEKKMEKETLIQVADRARGYVSKAPFARKAQLMVNLLGEEYGEFVAKDYKNKYLAIEKEQKLQFEKKLRDMYGGNQRYENEYEECLKKIEILNAYLPLSAKNHEAYQRATLHKFYDWTNQSLYWWRFLNNEDQYKIMFHNLVSDFFEALHEYDELQVLYPTPLWITNNCQNVQAPQKNKKSDDDSLEMYCPINVKVAVGIGSYKQNCKGMEIEGGELLIIGYEEDFRTGEFSFAFGLGAEGRLPVFSAGTKGQMFFKFAKDLTPMDCGMKFEAGGEANVAGFMVEEKMVAVIGMTSGIHVNALDMGREVNVFEMDPTK